MGIQDNPGKLIRETDKVGIWDNPGKLIRETDKVGIWKTWITQGS